MTTRSEILQRYLEHSPVPQFHPEVFSPPTPTWKKVFFLPCLLMICTAYFRRHTGGGILRLWIQALFYLDLSLGLHPAIQDSIPFPQWLYRTVWDFRICILTVGNINLPLQALSSGMKTPNYYQMGAPGTSPLFLNPEFLIDKLLVLR